MTETSSVLASDFDGEALRKKICEKIKNHRGTPESQTTAVAKIIINEGLGLVDEQIAEQYICSRGRQVTKVDLALTYEDTGLRTTKRNPKILLEFKRPDRKFIFGNNNYLQDINQLKKYMNSPFCETIEHGIIFNIYQLQVFRKHGNLVFPITRILDFPDCNNSSQQTIENIQEIIKFLKTEIIEQPYKHQLPGTIITLWNNKGGVGKTTTASYLSLFLNLKSCPRSRTKTNKVIAIDFDHNQANLTNRFKCEKTNGKTKELLDYIKIHKSFDEFELKGYFEQVKSEKQRIEIDFLPADQALCRSNDVEYETKFYKDNILRKLCLELAKEYDYIIIDAPPGWEQNIYARSAVLAADCLLPIGLYGDFDSFNAYYSVVCDKLSEVYQIRNDGGPDDLGLWINKWKSRDRNIIRKMNSEEIKFYISKAPKEKQGELRQKFLNDNNLRTITYNAWIEKSSSHNSNRKVNLLETLGRNDIQEAYSALLKSIIGGGK